MSIQEKLFDLIVEQLSVDKKEITMEAKFKDDLGADSLDIVEFVMIVEETFDVEVTDTEAEGLTTVGELVEFLEKKKNE